MPENTGMRRICTKLGFNFERVPDSQNVMASIELTRTPRVTEVEEEEIAAP